MFKSRSWNGVYHIMTNKSFHSLIQANRVAGRFLSIFAMLLFYLIFFLFFFYTDCLTLRLNVQ